MGDKSAIEWTDATWNPIVGCSIVSPGCTNCYAMTMAARINKLTLSSHYEGLTKQVNGHQVWTGKLKRAPDHIVTAPLRWKRPRRIFVNSMGDLFHEDVPDAWIDRVFAVMALCPQHTFQVLTKRSKRMREYMTERWQGTPAQTFKFSDGTSVDLKAGGETGRDYQIEMASQEFVDAFNLCDTDNDHHWDANGSCKAMQWKWPLPNVWLGVSCEDQRRADERIPDLLATPAAVRFVSAEPLLGPIDFGNISAMTTAGPEQWDCLDKSEAQAAEGDAPDTTIDWIIAGGESGRDARPMHADWLRGIRDQCAAAGVAFFFKQWGEHLPWHQFNEAKIEDDPEQTRFKTMEWNDGRWNDVGFPMWCDSTDGNIDDDNCVARIGKKRAGRLLDGIEHNGYPA